MHLAKTQPLLNPCDLELCCPTLGVYGFGNIIYTEVMIKMNVIRWPWAHLLISIIFEGVFKHIEITHLRGLLLIHYIRPIGEM